MSRKFSNKKVVNPKVENKRVKQKRTAKSKVANIAPIEFNGTGALFLIMANHKNKQYNIDSTMDTWIKDLGSNNDYCFVLERPMNKIKHFTINTSPKQAEKHDAYSNRILLDLFKDKINIFASKFERICFCTDTTYINVSKFNSDKKHWGYVSSMLPSSTEKLLKINSKISPEEVRMYHGEAGFCLSSDAVIEISKMIASNNDLVLDRWDATIGYCMHLMGAKFNHDEKANLFPHTILNHSSKEIKDSKSYGYCKFYDKKHIFDTIKSQ